MGYYEVATADVRLQRRFFGWSQLSLSPEGAIRPSSLLRERVRAAGRRCHSAVLIVAVLAALVGAIRLLLADGSRNDWPLFVLVIPGQVLF